MNSTETFTTQDDAETEADARNSEGDDSVTWQTAFVSDGDDGYWIVVERDDEDDFGEEE